MLSGETPQRIVYGHTGWRKIGDRWAYLHAGGAIVAEGVDSTIVVSLSGALAKYNLPAPPSGTSLIDAVKASLRLLNLAPGKLMFPLLAATYRSILGGSDFSLFLAGAGLLPSMGQGQGTGMGGYSASRNSLANVGMYGLLPSLGGEPRRGQGGHSRAHGRQRPDGSTSTADNASEPLPTTEAAAGGRMLYVPLNYRDRVREYFERVAEETAR